MPEQCTSQSALGCINAPRCTAATWTPLSSLSAADFSPNAGAPQQLLPELVCQTLNRVRHRLPHLPRPMQRRRDDSRDRSTRASHAAIVCTGAAAGQGPGWRERPPAGHLRAPAAPAGEAKSGETIVEIVEMGATARETAAARRRRRVPGPRGGCHHACQPTR